LRSEIEFTGFMQVPAMRNLGSPLTAGSALPRQIPRSKLFQSFTGENFMHAKHSSFLAAVLLAGTLIATPANPAIAKGQPPEGSAMPKVGDMAPDFTLNYFDGNDLKPVSLSQYRGKKNVVVAFFIFAFTGG
jgi:hypothetical protein